MTLMSLLVVVAGEMGKCTEGTGSIRETGEETYTDYPPHFRPRQNSRMGNARLNDADRLSSAWRKR